MPPDLVTSEADRLLVDVVELNVVELLVVELLVVDHDEVWLENSCEEVFVVVEENAEVFAKVLLICLSFFVCPILRNNSCELKRRFPKIF